MKLFVVNLAREAGRREFMRQQLDRLGLDYEFIVGTDYREMSPEDYQRLCAPHVVTGDNRLKGGCAASLSQITAYQKMIDAGLDYALVCEDDAVFPADMAQILRQLAPHLRADEIVMLSYYSHAHDALALSSRDPRVVTDKLTLLAPVDIDKLGSAMAYIIPLAVAKQMIARVMPIGYPLDNWGKNYHRGGFAKLRCLYPHIMEAAPVVSTIAYPARQTVAFRLKQLLRRLPIAGLHARIRRIAQRKLAAKHQFRIVDAAPFSSTGDGG